MLDAKIRLGDEDLLHESPYIVELVSRNIDLDKRIVQSYWRECIEHRDNSAPCEAIAMIKSKEKTCMSHRNYQLDSASRRKFRQWRGLDFSILKISTEIFEKTSEKRILYDGYNATDDSLANTCVII